MNKLYQKYWSYCNQECFECGVFFYDTPSPDGLCGSNCREIHKELLEKRTSLLFEKLEESLKEKGIFEKKSLITIVQNKYAEVGKPISMKAPEQVQRLHPKTSPCVTELTREAVSGGNI